MRPIVPSPAPPASAAPAHLAPVTCTAWCIDGSGHPGITDPAEQRCRSTVRRIEASLGGGHGPDDNATTSGGLYLQAERVAGESPTYTLGVELGGSEYWLRLRRSDVRSLIIAARTLLSQVPAA